MLLSGLTVILPIKIRHAFLFSSRLRWSYDSFQSSAKSNSIFSILSVFGTVMLFSNLFNSSVMDAWSCLYSSSVIRSFRYKSFSFDIFRLIVDIWFLTVELSTLLLIFSISNLASCNLLSIVSIIYASTFFSDMKIPLLQPLFSWYFGQL